MNGVMHCVACLFIHWEVLYYGRDWFAPWNKIDFQVVFVAWFKEILTLNWLKPMINSWNYKTIYWGISVRSINVGNRPVRIRIRISIRIRKYICTLLLQAYLSVSTSFYELKYYFSDHRKKLTKQVKLRGK